MNSYLLYYFVVILDNSRMFLVYMVLCILFVFLLIGWFGCLMFEMKYFVLGSEI